MIHVGKLDILDYQAHSLRNRPPREDGAVVAPPAVIAPVAASASAAAAEALVRPAGRVPHHVLLLGGAQQLEVVGVDVALGQNLWEVLNIRRMLCVWSLTIIPR